MSKVFLTGSRAYGPVTKNSDVDIVMDKVYANILSKILKTLGVILDIIADYGEASSFKFTLPGLPPINIIVANTDVDFQSWRHATNKMRLLPPVIDRENRINIFHNLFQEGFSIAVKKKAADFADEYTKYHAVSSPTGMEVEDIVNDLWR